MKLTRYVNGAWVVVDKELKQLTTATDSAASPISIIAPLAEPFDNYRVYGTAEGAGEATQLGIQLDEPLRGLGDIKDTLDVSTGVLTRRIGVVVLDGTEGQIPDGNTTRYFFITIASTLTVTSTTDQLCSHYSYAIVATGTAYVGFRVVGTSIGNTRIAIRSPNTDLDTTEKYRAFYASEYANRRPVTAYYVLANPVTEQVDVPPGLTGTIEGYLTQSGTPTESVPIYPEANGVELPNGKYEVYADVYKIPLTVSGNNSQSQSYDAYIGSSKLYAEEYLDYESGKVYKRTAQLFNKDARDTENGFRSSRYLNIDGSISVSTKLNISEYIPIEANTTYELYYGSAGDDICLCLYNASKDMGTGLIPYNGDSPITFTTGSNDAYIRLSYRKNAIDSTMLAENELPASYTPYLQPTDPPVPFPSVQHYDGESTISVDTTVAPDKLELTYQGWRVAANPEPKFYHNGQWMTEYRRVEYLKSTGTQAITTNIVPLSTTRTELDIKFGSDIKGSSASGYERGIFGAAEADGSNNVKAQYIVNALKGSPNSLIFYNKFTWHSGISVNYLNNPDNFDTADNAKQTVAMQGGIGSWGSTSIDFTSEMLNWPELTIPLVVFGTYNAAGGGLLPFQVKELSVYEMRTYDNNTLTHNLIPVERQIDGVLGLYDTITDTFYTNSGTGTFVKGGYI